MRRLLAAAIAAVMTSGCAPSNNPSSTAGGPTPLGPTSPPPATPGVPEGQWISLTNERSGLCLGVRGADDHTSGTDVIVGDCVPDGSDPGLDNQWRLVPRGSDAATPGVIFYRIENRVFPGRCLGVEGTDNHQIGARVGVYDCNEDPGRDNLWALVDPDPPHLQIRNRVSGLCLGVKDEPTACFLTFPPWDPTDAHCDRQLDVHRRGHSVEVDLCGVEENVEEHKDSIWRYDSGKGGMFDKPGNNGSVNCNAFCENQGGNWGPKGKCIGGRVNAGPRAGQRLPCGDGLSELGDVTCLCWNPPCAGEDFESRAACARARLDPVANCQLKNTPLSSVAMSLYVAGFNHDRVNPDKYVDRRGVDELVEVITSDPFQKPDQLVIAFSESNLWSCDAGEYIGKDGQAQNGECVAHALQQKLGARFAPGTRFEIAEDYHYWEKHDSVNKRGGYAVITGPRWRWQRPPRHVEIECPSDVIKNPKEGECSGALEVRLEDALDPGRVFNLYVVHTGGGDIVHRPGMAFNEPCKAIDGDCERRCKLELQGVAKVAQEAKGENDLAPMIVGDFNCNTDMCVKKENSDGSCPENLRDFLKPTFLWGNDSVSLAQVPGNFGDPFACGIHMEHQIVHALVGRRNAPPGQYLSSFRPVSLRYSKGPVGSPLSPADGIWLPDVAHNVVAMDLVIESGPEVEQPPPGKCACRLGALGTDGSPTGSIGVAVGLLLMGCLRRRGRSGGTERAG